MVIVMKKDELIGKRFGKLVVTGEIDPYISPKGIKTRRFDCKCDCGKTVTVLRNELSRGRTSCGCSRYDKTRIDLTGKRYGKLEVLKIVDLEKAERNGITHGWLCKCDCGNTIVCTSKQLINNKKISCGCAVTDALKSDNRLKLYDGTMISALNPDRKANKNSKTGIKGVYWSKREQRYITKIGIKNKNITIGRFSSLEEAAKARKKAEEQYFAPEIEKYEKSKIDRNKES